MAPEPKELPTKAGGTPPLVSIVVPSFNQAPFLRDALDSILHQDYRPLELLVLDGGSTDGTVDILQEYAATWPELRWWSEPDGGVVDAVNKGLARATGPVVGIQSSDDVYLEGAVSSAVRALCDDPNLGLVYGDGCGMDEHGRAVYVTRYEPFSLEALLCGATCILQGNAFFRLDEARALGGWRDRYFVADLDLWFRMVFRTGVVKVDHLMSGWRIHPQQRNNRTGEIWSSYGRMIDESPDIAGLSLRLRRAAASGRHAFTQFYNPWGSHWHLRYQLCRAIAAYPPVIRTIDTEALVPGLRSVRAWLGRSGPDPGPRKSRPPRPAFSGPELEAVRTRWWEGKGNESGPAPRSHRAPLADIEP